MLYRCLWFLVFAYGCSACRPEPVSNPENTARTSLGFTSQAGDTAITDVTVVPMSNDAVLAQHTVVIRGDRIVAVAPRAAVTLPAGVTVIDGSGKWLLPGLADMHVHTWEDDELLMFLAAGVTSSAATRRGSRRSITP